MTNNNLDFNDILIKYCSNPAGFYIDAEANGKYGHLEYKHFANVFNDYVNNTSMTPDRFMEEITSWDCPELAEIATGIKLINDGDIIVTESRDFFKNEILPEMTPDDICIEWEIPIDDIVDGYVEAEREYADRDILYYNGYVIEYR